MGTSLTLFLYLLAVVPVLFLPETLAKSKMAEKIKEVGSSAS